MRKNWRCLPVLCLLANEASLAQSNVFSYEFVSDPVSEGWDLDLRYCEPHTWNSQGWYYQQLSLEACPPDPQGGLDRYRNSLQPFNGTKQFFAEFRLNADGDRSEIPFGAPTVVAMGNSFGVAYHITVARDVVKFFRDADLPIWFVEIEPGVPHIFRIELYPDRYVFYVDDYLIDEGFPEGPFPAQNASFVWKGNSWELPCLNAWDYFRYGLIPDDASGDYDSDAAVTLIDHYFVVDCLTKDGPGLFGGPGEDAGPGCGFADFDADSDTDLRDFAEFQNGFGG